jgi:rsbT antagonist protein RsbS
VWSREIAGPAAPLPASILRQQAFLVVSIHTALDDGQLLELQRRLIAEVGEYRARGLILDVAALDVIDSFAARTLRNLAHAARLRGAVTVVVGIAPEVAGAMVELGMGLDGVQTELDLEDGLAVLQEIASRPRGGTSGPGVG